MKLINWQKENEIRDAYILDGVNPKKAKKMAKNDCKNNEYEQKLKKIEKQELEDLETIEGANRIDLAKTMFSKKRNSYSNEYGFWAGVKVFLYIVGHMFLPLLGVILTILFIHFIFGVEVFFFSF